MLIEADLDVGCSSSSSILDGDAASVGSTSQVLQQTASCPVPASLQVTGEYRLTLLS